ncbi:signal transduction histidine kinase, nitrogen specific, NtrB [Desulfarculus baarsii DSM 2075]|uniref:histidine kinase n=1 Tax=Desulfarculus baarsii (strain ATCC 33931 / DSM 2075 / LMG 7858 / VKM B-1802 / 2st14) TaxID=644282 RepID=E1QK77_DESB2|nr:PAS domain S-box protein [Desulfarculus baarsii]ADK85970.1 signal transduction histidine kinase, nitrogen specific, NtrB [Desulfarculus baarsii DSM 2075]
MPFRRTPHLSPVGVSLSYALVGSLWILCSDFLVDHLFQTPQLIAQAQTWKGWFFIAVTALLLYVVLSRREKALGRHVADVEAKERAVEQKERLFRQLADNISEALWVQNVSSGRVVYANPRYEDVFGLPRQGLMADPLDFLRGVHPDDAPDLRDALGRGRAGQRQFRLLWPDGSTRWVDWREIDLESTDGPLLARLAQDITDDRDRLGQMRRQRDLTWRYLDVAGVIMVAIGPDETVRMINRKGCEALGWAEAEALGVNWFDNFLPADAREQTRNLFHAMDASYPQAREHENLVLTKGGGLRLVKWRNVALRDEQGRFDGCISSGEDVTEQRRNMESRRRLTLAVEHVAEGVLITDTKGLIEYANSAAAAIAGLAQGGLVGQNWFELAAGGQAPVAMAQAMRDGEVWRGVFDLRRPDGPGAEMELTASPVLSGPGLVANYVVLIRDVTHERLLERKLRQAQKMEAIGTLASGITHDFNNILGAIIGYAELCLWDLSDDSPLRQNLEQVLVAGDRAKDLVQQILTFSRQAEQEKKALNLGPVIKESLKLMRATLPTTVELRQDISAEPCLVMADPVQMQQVVMNLCTNAAHAIGDRPGMIQVTLKQLDVDRDRAASHPDLAAGRYLRLSVGDNGRGIAPEHIEKIFDPYFTTKKPGQGTGLGLSTVHGIVKTHGGVINVYSEPGQGATFSIWLPLADEAERGAGVMEPGLYAGTESVLLVDDEQTLVETGRGLLERMGYRVTAFTSATEALAAFAQDPDSFDVIVTDQNMPHLSGLSLAKQATAIRPMVAVVLCTGFSEALTNADFSDLGVDQFVMKPVLGNQLGRAIRAALAAKRPNL